MHLGRFHAVIYDLTQHFDEANLVETLNDASSSIRDYANNHDEALLQQFKEAIAQLLVSATVNDKDLQQPYAQQVISELNLIDLVNPSLSLNVSAIIQGANYDPAGLSEALKKLSSEVEDKIGLIKQLETAFEQLNVEYQGLDASESEIGFLLPREVVGDKLSDLSKEFDQLNKLSRAISEFSGDSVGYEPSVRTISSSWWQVFLDLSPEQILIFVIAIERIVNLFKSNLEIKNLSRQLKDKQLPDKITKQIEDEVEKRVKAEIVKIAKDIRKQNSKGKDKARLNELETQLRQGLSYLARRLNQGMQVEINIGLPSPPQEPDAKEGEQPDKSVLKEIEKKQQEIARITALRERAFAISVETTSVAKDAPLLIEVDADKPSTKEPSAPKKS